MGQTISKLTEKLLQNENSNKQERRGIMHDVTMDSEIDFNSTSEKYSNTASTNISETSAKTPPNLMRLKCDPRSPPAEFDRTPLKVPLED